MVFGKILAFAKKVATAVLAATGLAKALTSAGENADENFGEQEVGSAVASCPVTCPTAVEIKAPDGVSQPCNMIPVNGSLQLRAMPRPEDAGTQYRWTSSSGKIQLEQTDQETVTIIGLDDASASRDAETVKVECSAEGCTPVTATTTLTVVKVTFSESASQSYGYDDMDTVDDATDDHVSVKKLGTTVIHTVIEGGLTGSDLEFVCDPEDVATPAAGEASAEFNLTVTGDDDDQAETVLKALLGCNCPEAERECTHIQVNTYKEKLVAATVAKVHDSHVPATALRFPNLDVAATATLINTKYKTAVAQMTLSDHSDTGAEVDVRYDLDGNGKLTYDIVNGGGAELNAIKLAVAVAGWRVVTVRDMVSVYFLASAAAVGDSTITINTASHFYVANDSAPLGTGATRENITIQSFAGATLTLASPLTNAHAIGEPIEFPAAGWSGNPVVIIEGSASEEELKWTIAHELGHSALNLVDVTHNKSVMHYKQGAADHRLRYLPLPKHYASGDENQWETISR